MSANSRWPDISRVSSLFNPFGPKGTASDEASNVDHEQRETKAATGDAPSRNGADSEMMTDVDGQPMHGMGAFDDDYADDGPDDMGSDFPALPMFDSSAADVPFSSRNDASFASNNQAPTADMGIEEPAASKKAKKDKKKKKKGADQEQPHEEGHHKRAKRQSAVDEEEPATSEQAPTGSMELGEEPHPSAQQSKRKRKSSDGAEGKRKKRKAQGAAPDAMEEVVEDENAAAFLRKDPKSGAAQLEVAVEEDATGESDPQRSPTVAHLRRQSQSRSREPSATEDQLKQEMGAWAGQAWDEETGGNNAETADAPMPDAPEGNTAHNGDDAPAQEEPAAPARRKSTRQTSKPTFFDQPAPDDLPSPAAMTPKPRKRTKPATKKQKQPPPKRAHSMQGGDDDGYAEDRPRRKNRMEGYTKGRFTEDEMGRMSKQIKDFADENNLTTYQVNEMIHAPGGTQAGEDHAQLWSRLFAECPDRHRQKVINIVRKTFHNFVARGTWTPEQDAEFRSLIEVHGSSWAKIGGLLNRHPEDLRDRYRNYIVCGDKQKKDSWTEEEERELAQHIEASMRSLDELRRMQPNRPLLQRPYEELIDWQNISELMGRTRSRLQCITKWKSMGIKMRSKDKMQSLQADSQISFHLEKARRQLADMPAEERHRLILAIAQSSATEDNKVPWSKLVDRAWRMKWQRKTLVLLWHRLKKTVAGWDRKSTRDVAQELVEAYGRTGELPDVDSKDYDEIEEMQILQTCATPHARSDKKNAKSDAIVSSADIENDEQEESAPQGDAEPQIDPALYSEPAAADAAIAKAALAADPGAAVDDVEAEAGLAEATPAPNRTPGKKTATYGKKRGSAKKTTPNILNQDPIEDSTTDPSQELPQLPLQDTQEVKDPAPKRQRAAKGKGRKRPAKSAETVPTGASSDVDEGEEDLPATVAEAAE